MGIKSAILASAVVTLVSMAGSVASAMTYDLSLSNSSGQIVGSGMFTIGGPVAASGVSTFSAGASSPAAQLTDMSFNIAGNTFNLGTQFRFLTPTVTFDNGLLSRISYLGFSTSNAFKLDLDTFNLNYVLVDLRNFPFIRTSTGTISESVSTTPLPSGLPLFVTGLLALAMVGWRKKRSLQAQVA